MTTNEQYARFGAFTAGVMEAYLQGDKKNAEHVVGALAIGLEQYNIERKAD